ncbi:MULTISPECIES: sporulation integral membrane protein YlbJ [Clostridium]|uniref:Sporulation integral membrane protein YlbJ n=1 Tax=Clostridium disporicum TaxID=84024 RepID=A0A173YWM0_9CLOT|nr:MULTISPECIES: sporulation integral membrane protein YlbJ [Clostridium]MCD2501632.1 sporulation integral membrane protein YlbJ [Clostridium sp. NSJ-145]CUN67967.1 sporulation integral membrane protein YlbJ [Clostridium disporicum]
MHSIIFLWLSIFILIFVLLKLLNINKNYFVSFLISFCIILFVLNLKDCINASLVGLNLVIKTILPTIFPFSFICNLLICYDGISLYSKILGPLLCRPLKLSKNSSFPIAASVLCGYPLGCKYCCDLYNLGYINKKEFERLLNIASNASPMFLIGSVGATMFGNTKLGFILLIANYLSPLIIGIITIPKGDFNKNSKVMHSEFKKVSIGSALKTSIENSVNTTLQVGAFVIIFSIIISIIKSNAYISITFKNIEDFLNIPSSSLYGTLLGSIEFTNGCKLISSSTLPLILKLSIISFICSFSGLSVIAQISSFIGDLNISLFKYSFLKFIQGIISFIITFIACIFFVKDTPVSTFPIQTFYIDNKILLIIYCILILSLICTFIRYKKNLHVS